MWKKQLIKNAIILFFTSIFLRAAELIFRVYVTNIIGPEAIGLYQLIFTIYILAVTFATTGINVAVTRLVAEEYSKHSFLTVRKIITIATILVIVLSVTVSFGMISLADFIGTQLLKDSRTVLPIKILSLSLPFIGVTTVFKGYFYAIRKVVKPVSAQILEEFINMCCIIVVGFTVGLSKGIEVAITYVVCGTTLAEIIATLYIALLYYIEKERIRYNPNDHSKKGITKKILLITLPLAASSYLRSTLNTIENILVPIGIKKNGKSQHEALAEYGTLKGMVIPIIFFPAAIVSAFASLLIPEVAEAKALNFKKSIVYAVNRSFQFTLFIAIFVSGIFITYAEPLSIAIYHNNSTAIMMKMLAPIIPLMYLDMVVDQILKALDEQNNLLKINVIDSTIRIILIYFLLPIHGINGYVMVLIFSNIFNSYLSTRRLLKVTDCSLNVVNWIIKPIIGVFAACYLVNGALKSILFERFNYSINLFSEITIVTILYITFVILIDTFTKDDINWFKNLFKW